MTTWVRKRGGRKKGRGVSLASLMGQEPPKPFRTIAELFDLVEEEERIRKETERMRNLLSDRNTKVH